MRMRLLQECDGFQFAIIARRKMRYDRTLDDTRRRLMPKVLIISAVLLTGFAASVQPGHAGPFCMNTSIYNGPPDCSYRTWAACRASLPGVGNYCYPNAVAGYVFDTSDPANPRVVAPRTHRDPRARY
jgi:hypothetical protein